MASVFLRGKRYYARLLGLKKPGQWGTARTPHTDEAKAKKWAADAQREIDRLRAEPATIPTVQDFATKWIETRRQIGLDWRSDRSHMKTHIAPAIGSLLLPAVTAQHVLSIVQGMRAKKKAPRTVYNVYSTMSALFRDAQIAGHIQATPCILTNVHLGDRVDGDDDWRKDAVFERDELVMIISDPRVPFDRRVDYALDFLAGTRHGEAAGLRWFRYEPNATPLGRLRIARSYDSRDNAEKKTKTKAERHVPVHPALAQILDAWWSWGWRETYGRDPKPDDLIIPLPPDDVARRRRRTGEAFRSFDYSGKKWRDVDLPILGLRHRRGHDARSTFITLAIADGASRDVIRDHVTHTKPKQSAFDGYDRGTYWEVACHEVAKLRIELPATSLLQRPASQWNRSDNVVEAEGIEPSSENASERTSTRVGTLFEVSGSPAAAGL